MDTKFIRARLLRDIAKIFYDKLLLVMKFGKKSNLTRSLSFFFVKRF